MDAVDFFKEMKRFCHMQENCGSCILNEQTCGCVYLRVTDSEKLVEIVEKWSEENPTYSYYDEFCKRFPKHKYKSPDRMRLCVNDIFGTNYVCDYDCICEKCWRLEYKGE